MKSMMMVGLACIVLAGCAGGATEQAAAISGDELVWGRFDCRGDAGVATMLEQARVICSNTAQANGVAAAVPTGLISGMIVQNSVHNSTMKACMAQQGFVLAPRRDYERKCGAVPAR